MVDIGTFEQHLEVYHHYKELLHKHNNMVMFEHLIKVMHTINELFPEMRGKWLKL